MCQLHTMHSLELHRTGTKSSLSLQLTKKCETKLLSFGVSFQQ